MEAIRSAAIRINDAKGTVVEDSTHYGAYLQALDAGLLKAWGINDADDFEDVYDSQDVTAKLGEMMEDGFVTTEGRFVDREQAMIIAYDAGQADVNDDRDTLDSSDFEHLDAKSNVTHRYAESLVHAMIGGR